MDALGAVNLLTCRLNLSQLLEKLGPDRVTDFTFPICPPILLSLLRLARLLEGVQYERWASADPPTGRLDEGWTSRNRNNFHIFPPRTLANGYFRAGSRG